MQTISIDGIFCGCPPDQATFFGAHRQIVALDAVLNMKYHAAENLSPQTVYLNFKKLVTATGYPNVRFHDLRHSYAVAALQSGDDIKTVQENLGHHTAAFTLDIYGHVTDKMRRDSAQRMQVYIDSLQNPV